MKKSFLNVSGINTKSFVSKDASKAKLDYFNGHLAEDAIFCGEWDIPYVESSGLIPDKVITFTKCTKSDDYDAWVVFYEDDASFERLWKNPDKYLPILQKFKGVVCPDFSLYGDYPLATQIFNTYRSRLIGHWLKRNGVNVIPNVRWSTKYSYTFCFDGLKKEDIVFVGTHGCVKRKADRQTFEEGFKEMVIRIHPSVICVYGKANLQIFRKLEEDGIQIKQFESEYSLTHEVD